MPSPYKSVFMRTGAVGWLFLMPARVRCAGNGRSRLPSCLPPHVEPASGEAAPPLHGPAPGHLRGPSVGRCVFFAQPLPASCCRLHRLFLLLPVPQARPAPGGGADG